MAAIQTSTLVHAPLERVFALAADVDRWPQIISGILKVEFVSPAPVQVGTRVRETRKMFGKEHTEEMEFLEWNPPHSYVLGAESGGCAYRTTLAFSREGEATRACLDFVSTPKTLLARMCSWMFFFMKGMLKRCLETDLADIKRAAEDSTVPAPANAG